MKDLNKSLENLQKSMDLILEKIAANQKDWLTENEVAEFLGVTKQTIRNYRRSGDLKFSQERRKIFISREALNNFLNSKSN